MHKLPKPFYLLLALVLLIAQQALVLHAFSHLSGAGDGKIRLLVHGSSGHLSFASEKQSVDDSHPDSTQSVCVECLAFAQLSAGGINSNPLTIEFGKLSTAVVAAVDFLTIATPWSRYQARAPPALI